MTRRTLAIVTATLLLAASMEIPMADAQSRSPARTDAQASAALPNGATSLNETYQDWVVICATGEKGRVCVLSQQQRHKDSNQLVLAAEFTNVASDRLGGTLVLPFGLRLADGVTLQVDDGPVSAAIPFATCLPAGCILQLGFDAGFTAALRSGTTLKLTAKAHDSGQNVLFGVSLKGFAAGHDRAVALTHS